MGEVFDGRNESFDSWRRVYSSFGLSPTVIANVNATDRAIKVIVYEK